MSEGEIIPAPNAELMRASEVPTLLDHIRPAWQAKDLIRRVRRLLPVDPSSACQRIFNAAIHDLREKIVIAGLDIAREAAKEYKLPPVERAEHVEDYSTAYVIDLAYRMGLLSRPDWRRLSRVYEIRRDLEHEDDEYEAGVEDCIYVFKTCVEVVLARDPTNLLRVADVKEVVEQAGPITANQTLLDDYERAPQPRQEEILRFLVSIALNADKPEIVRGNAVRMLGRLEPLTQTQVKLNLATQLQDRIGRGRLDFEHARIAYASGTFTYLKLSQRREFFESFHALLQRIGFGWRAHAQHGEVLRMLKEVGGLTSCPTPIRSQIVEWLVLAYMGESGGYGQWGRNRRVFYSDTAAPLAQDLLTEGAGLILDELKACETASAVRDAAQDEHVARRFQQLLDQVESRTEGVGN